jgi:hypothetical protein
MKYRIAEFCALPSRPEYNEHIPFRMGNPEFFNEQLFKDPGMLSPADQRSHINGITSAAKALDCDFVIVNPPEYYRTLLEMSLSQEGLVPVYPEFEIAERGLLHLMRFKAGEHIPKHSTTQRLEDAYELWKVTYFSTIPEEDLAMCQDPFRMFIDREVRGLYQPSKH